jgi:hypothetical protein
MSEQSESVHLWHADRNQVRRVAHESGVLGRIIASNERWTCFVPFEDESSEAFARGTPGLTLIWTYSADFGLWIALFEAGRKLGTLGFEWGTAPGEASAVVIDRLRRDGIFEEFDDLLRLAVAVTPEGKDPKTLRNAVAARLGLAAYDWLSPAYSRDTPLEEIQAEFPSAEDLE